MEANRLQVTKTEREMQRMEIKVEWGSVKTLEMEMEWKWTGEGNPLVPKFH